MRFELWLKKKTEFAFVAWIVWPSVIPPKMIMIRLSGAKLLSTRVACDLIGWIVRFDMHTQVVLLLVYISADLMEK